MKFLTTVLFLMLSAPASGAGPQPLMTTPGKTLVSEDFSGPAVPSTWLARGEPNSFSIVDGTLQGICKPGGSHDPFVIVKLDTHNVTVQFAAKFIEKGRLLLAIDGHSDAFNGNTHLVRLSISPTEMSVQQDSGTPESKQQQKEANAKVRKEGKKPSKPSAEQLADPKFYRSELLGEKQVDFGIGKWHDVILEVCGRELVAQVDGQVAIVTGSSVVDADKSRMTFEVTGQGTVQIDNVRAYENTRRDDWEQVKRKIAPATAPSK